MSTLNFLSYTGVSGTTEDYDLIEMEGLQNIILTVITGPPVIDGLYDVYLLENSAMTLGFTVTDEDGSDISIELTDDAFVAHSSSLRETGRHCGLRFCMKALAPSMTSGWPRWAAIKDHPNSVAWLRP